MVARVLGLAGIALVACSKPHSVLIGPLGDVDLKALLPRDAGPVPAQLEEHDKVVAVCFGGKSDEPADVRIRWKTFVGHDMITKEATYIARYSVELLKAEQALTVKLDGRQPQLTMTMSAGPNLGLVTFAIKCSRYDGNATTDETATVKLRADGYTEVLTTALP